MKTIVKRIAGALFLLGMIPCLQAQDARFTQMLNHPLRFNPAVMGSNSDLRVIGGYRTQWAAIDKGYRSISATALSPIYLSNAEEKLDLGLSFIKDDAGAFSTLDASLAIGYNLKVSTSGYLSFAMLAGYVQKSLDASNLTFDEQYVLGSFSASNATSETVLNEKSGYPDVGFGMMWYFNPDTGRQQKLTAYAGAAGFHLNRPNESFTNGFSALPRRFSFQGGVKILGKEKVDFTPNVVVNVQEGSEEVAAGLYVDYRFNESMKLVFGTWYRKKDAIPFYLGFEHKSFTFGYNYDLTVSELSKAIPGAHTHEITLSYKLNMAEKKGLDSMPSFF